MLSNLALERVAQSGTELLELQADSCFPPPLTGLGEQTCGFQVAKGCEMIRRMLKAPTSCPLSSKPCILSRLWAITLSAGERSYCGNDNVINILPSPSLSLSLYYRDLL